jgi:hypothetical protein
MSAKQGKSLWLSIVALIITLTAIYLTSAMTRPAPSPVNQPAATIISQPEQREQSAEGEAPAEYVRRGRLRPRLYAVLGALGDRLEKPGKERLTLTGTIIKAERQQAIPVLLIWEFPGKLRLEEQIDGQRRVIIFNGNDTRGNGNSLSRRDEDLIETLIHDSTEHFLISQLDGAATRFLGTRFRLDDGTATNYEGPFYDLYETSEMIKVRREAQKQTKVYYFNSDTHLLEQVKYQVLREGIATAVEVRLNNWHEVQEQKLPGEIVRLENGTPVLTFTITSTGIGSRAADGIFSNP